MVKNNKVSPLILASASLSRRKMLQQAGIACGFAAADINESSIKSKMQDQGVAYRMISEHLATQKACAISEQYPGSVILGADQLLVCDGQLFDKAQNMVEAEQHLRFFRGKAHQLFTSFVLVRDGEILACETVVPELTMRGFSDQFLQDYLEKSGDAILGSVGCYLLEERGPQLFSDIQGDYFAILGLPLLKVLDHLRQWGMIDQ